MYTLNEICIFKSVIVSSNMLLIALYSDGKTTYVHEVMDYGLLGVHFTKGDYGLIINI